MGRHFTSKQREIIWKLDKGYCGLCGKKAKKNNWQADHIYPWILGGETTVNNGQVSHPWCNREKWDKFNSCGGVEDRNGFKFYDPPDDLYDTLSGSYSDDEEDESCGVCCDDSDCYDDGWNDHCCCTHDDD